jgi:hypothetical protein
MASKRDRILLELRQLLNLAFPSNRTPLNGGDTVVRAFNTISRDARACGLSSEELQAYVSHQWLPKRNVEAEKVRQFVQKHLI